MRLTPVMLALLLALSPGAVALQASAPTSSSTGVVEQARNDTVRAAPGGNTSVVMTLGTSPSRTGFDAPSLALGSSLAMGHDGFETQLSVNALDKQLEAAKAPEKKKQALNRFRYQIQNQIISLKAKEEQVTSAFSNGTITEREYLRALGRIDAKAEEIRTGIDALKTRSQTTEFNFDDKSLKTRLVTVEGPVRDRIGKAIEGRTGPIRVYVETADTGVVLSTIVGGTYVRETYRRDNRDPSTAVSIDKQEAKENVIRSRYPWIVDNWTGEDRRVYTPVQVVRFIYDYPHGSLTAYVDTGTASVYREIQHKRLTGENSVPPGPGVTNSSENVTVTVNRTYPGGPLRVKLTNATGAPLDGQITVAGEPVGRTHGDGVVWALGPTTQFRVSATYGDTTVNVTATPVEAGS